MYVLQSSWRHSFQLTDYVPYTWPSTTPYAVISTCSKNAHKALGRLLLCYSKAKWLSLAWSGMVESNGESGPCAAENNDPFFCLLVWNVILDNEKKKKTDE